MFKKIALAAALAAVASSSFAADTMSYYAGVDAGTTKIDAFSGHKTSFGGFIGVQLTENLAIEGGYRRLGDFDQRVGSVNVGVTADQAALSLVGTLPFGNGFSAIGRIGYNRLDAEASVGNVKVGDNTSKALYGAGIAYAISPTVSARIEALKPASDTTNISVGVVFKF